FLAHPRREIDEVVRRFLGRVFLRRRSAWNLRRRSSDALPSPGRRRFFRLLTQEGIYRLTLCRLRWRLLTSGCLRLFWFRARNAQRLNELRLARLRSGTLFLYFLDFLFNLLLKLLNGFLFLYGLGRFAWREFRWSGGSARLRGVRRLASVRRLLVRLRLLELDVDGLDFRHVVLNRRCRRSTSRMRARCSRRALALARAQRANSIGSPVAGSALLAVRCLAGSRTRATAGRAEAFAVEAGQRRMGAPLPFAGIPRPSAAAWSAILPCRGKQARLSHA